jgi:hypothetical protein
MPDVIKFIGIHISLVRFIGIIGLYKIAIIPNKIVISLTPPAALILYIIIIIDVIVTTILKTYKNRKENL